ncbi:MAG TPA: 2-amino-4-hydroxy-6-hydroxymethyldihydropteridine diphosphokinase [Alphaproteobacteria bacterium]|nr:2-amino-4-hydroxy-6-hydroxymethyldihydropteridine diphosphokinase [Alphaproteobacteria bacterium]
MILIGLGANLPSPRHGPPRQTLEAALARLAALGAPVQRHSPWYRSAPVPASDQPWFVNGVAELDWPGTAEELLALLHRVEAEFGRVRLKRWEARVLDLDLLAFGDAVIGWPPEGEGLTVPHPRLHERLFVLCPLNDLAPGWRHPVFGRTAAELLASLPSGQGIEPLADDEHGG